jgi:hypothetical protein
MAASRIIAIGLIALVAGIAIGYAVTYAVPFALPTSSKPSISLSANSVKTGEEYRAKFVGFPAKTVLYGWTVNEDPPRMFEVGTTDDKGELEVTSNAPQTPGTWLIVACDKAQNNWATVTLNVSES